MYPRIDRCDQLHGLIGAEGSNKGIGTRNSRDDILSDPHRQHFGHSLDIELLGPCKRFLINPLHVFEVVVVALRVRVFFLPLDFQRVLDAMFGSARRIGNRAIVCLSLCLQAVQQAAVVA